MLFCCKFGGILLGGLVISFSRYNFHIRVRIGIYIHKIVALGVIHLLFEQPDSLFNCYNQITIKALHVRDTSLITGFTSSTVSFFSSFSFFRFRIIAANPDTFFSLITQNV